MINFMKIFNTHTDIWIINYWRDKIDNERQYAICILCDNLDNQNINNRKSVLAILSIWLVWEGTDRFDYVCNDVFICLYIYSLIPLTPVSLEYQETHDMKIFILHFP